MTDLPHILYVGAALPSRSETFVYREVLGLRERGAKVSVASVHRPQTDLGDPVLDGLAAEAVPIYGRGPGAMVIDAAAELMTRPARAWRVAMRGLLDACTADDVPLTRRHKLLWQCMAGLALARRVRPQQVGHLHAHMAHVPTTITMYAAMSLDVPFSFTGHAADLFRDRSLLARKLQRAAFVACISHWHRRFYQDVARRPAPVPEREGLGEGDSSRASAPLPDERLPIVRCGVDVPPHPDASESSTDPSIDILAVGRMVGKKGFDLLIRAFAQLGPAHASRRLVIVGDGPQRDALHDLCRELGVVDRVDLPGARNHAQVLELMRRASLFVLPCRQDQSGDRDGIPVVLMEAMAREVCVISGDIETIRELVIDDRTGRMVHAEDVDALTEAIGRLLDDAAERSRLAAAGRRHVAAEFSSDINLARLEQALRLSVSQDGPAVPAAVPGYTGT